MRVRAGRTGREHRYHAWCTSCDWGRNGHRSDPSAAARRHAAQPGHTAVVDVTIRYQRHYRLVDG